MDNGSARKKTNKIIYIVLISLIVIGAIIGLTYAWFSWQSSTSSSVTITAGDITVTYEAGPNITGIKLIPVSSKEKGETDGTGVAKTITASSTEPTYMDLNMTLQTFPTALKHVSLVWEIYSGQTLLNSGNLGNSNQGDVISLLRGQQLSSTETAFKLYIWIDGLQSNPASMMNQDFTFVLNATATDQEPEPEPVILPNLDESGANEPKLVDGLIPVMYKNNNWVKTNEENNDEDYQWYDYDAKQWANAVLVKKDGYSPKITQTDKSLNLNTLETVTTYTSSNQSRNSTTSTHTFTFTTGSSAGTLSFDYSVSSQANSDTYTIKLGNTTLVNAISGQQSSSYSGNLSANTSYTLTVSYYKNNRTSSYDDEATISNIKVSNLSGNITASGSGSYPWTSATNQEYTLTTYQSYTLGTTGTYTLSGGSEVSAANSIGKYICSDTVSSSCATIYEITSNNGNIIDKADVYSSEYKQIRETYQEADNGTEVLEDDILAYYVWIPRYRYRTWNMSRTTTDSYNARTTGIDIDFEEGTATTGTIACTAYSFAAASSSALNQTCSGSNGDYYTHPAFTFGNQELEGIWFGKFELSSENPTASNGGGSSTTLTPRIKPNVISWRNNALSNYYLVIFNMQSSNNIYGLSTNRSEVDSHMIKNLEWGAAAYFANSEYGRCTNNSCTEVTINNNSSYYTGGNNYESNVAQSTTGNIYGIYDMSGGAAEYVMANGSSAAGSYSYYVRSAGSNYTYNASTTAKYIDTYGYGANNTYNTQTGYNRTRLGDSCGESRGWYSDRAYFLYYNYAWMTRGGYYGDTTYAGLYNFYYRNGGANAQYGSRAILINTTQPED